MTNAEIADWLERSILFAIERQDDDTYIERLYKKLEEYKTYAS